MAEENRKREHVLLEWNGKSLLFFFFCKKV